MTNQEQTGPTREDALAFVDEHHRAVLITRRASGGLQTSPVVVGRDDDALVLSSRETAYKVRNLRRDPRATLCLFTDAFYGPWLHVDGRAEVRSLPDAMEGLVAYYRRLQGEHPDWDDYRRAMREEQRVLVRVHVEAVGPARSG